MTAILPDYGVFYGAVPKVACTSIKRAFFALENDREFEPFKVNGRIRNIHDLYPTRPFDQLPQDRVSGLRRLALVRDPLDRFLSAYSNRVHKHKALSWWRFGEQLEKFGLAPDPGFEEYLDYFDKYRQASHDIYHHTLPMTFFLGSDPGYFDKLYGLRDMTAFCGDVSATAGKPFAVGRFQTEGIKIPRSSLTETQKQKIQDLYEDDYRLFGPWLD